MQRKRLTFWFTLMIVASVLAAGCAPRAQGGATASAVEDPALTIDLPALVIDFDSEGAASVGNVPLAQLGDMVAPGMLDQLTMQPETVGYMTESNIQHIQIANVPTGILILLNGEPLPSLKWDGEILTVTGEVLSELGVGAPLLEKLLPLITHIGVGVIVRFPMTDGVAAIPTYIEGGEAAMAARTAQEEFLNSVGSAPRINLPVTYEADGTWRVGDLTDTEWTNLTGLPWSSLRLQPNMIQALAAASISEVSISTDVDGIHIGINGNQLPYIGWADGELNHVLGLADQMGLWGTLADTGMNMGEIVGMVQTLLPVVQTAETSINITFPQTVAITS